MTDKELKKIISDLNNNSFQYSIDIMPLSKTVFYGETMFGETKNSLYEESKFYLIRNSLGKYIGVVLDMKIDLHVYIVPEERKKGHLVKHFNSVIFPHLKNSRSEQKINIQDPLLNEAAVKAALALGFEIVDIKKSGSRISSYNLLKVLEMETKDKIKKVEKFLSQPNNKLVWTKHSPHSHTAARYFDLDVSQKISSIDFSLCLEVQNIEEAVTILNEIMMKKDLSQARSSLEEKLNTKGINLDHKFYLTFMGNRDEDYENRNKKVAP
jgi:uncharacterized protein YjbK